MCGIAGWIDFERDILREGDTLRQMGDTMGARGPDDAQEWMTRHAGFSHRRLVVVDPEGGAQPMTRDFSGRRLVIVYNGELYNTDELRQQLQRKGYRFRGHSDTEVLLSAYAEWGEHCPERLLGIFAFAVYSPSEERLFIARDRLGVKPLFYAERGGAFLFASELKALCVHPLVGAELDREGLLEALVMAPARTPGVGVFRGVRELRPGWALTHDRTGTILSQYWRLEAQLHTDDIADTAGRVRSLLRDAVESQLVSDVPLCGMLSGGLDSSAVCLFADEALRRAGRGRLRTYSVEFAGAEDDFHPTSFQKSLDIPWVEKMRQFLGTDHRRIVLDTPDLVTHLPTALRARDLPGMADVDTSLYLFCREIRRESTVALSGESADEVFGGYPWFFRDDALTSGTFPWAPRLSLRLSFLTEDARHWLRPQEYVRSRYEEALAEVPRLSGEDALEARMRELLYLNITRFLPTLLDRKDRMSMATSLEVRVPFCDHRLVEYVYNIPWSMKTWGGHPKGILRLALRGLLPDDVLFRPKNPYPSTPNPLYLESMRQKALEISEDSRSALFHFLDRRAVQTLAREQHDPMSLPWFSQLMGLAQYFSYVVQLDDWLRTYRIETAVPA